MIRYFLVFACLSLLACSCSNAKRTTSSRPPVAAEREFRLKGIAEDSTYGYSDKNPVKVGGGPSNERRFFDALLGPGGEAVTYGRIGSCCAFKTKNGLIGDMGLLDKYEVSYRGLAKPLIIYINMYDADDLKAPLGFTIKQ